MLKNSVIVFLLVLLLPGRAFAKESDGLKVGSDGTVTLVSDYAVEAGVSSISFSLQVNSVDADKVEFYFNESNARIQDFRYDRESRKLNIYIAGTDALLKNEGQVLSIGRIGILDGKGAETGASVSVSSGSLMYVYGTELKWMQELELPGEVQVNASGGTAVTPTPVPLPTQAPTQNPDQPGSAPGSAQNPGTSQATPTPAPVPSAQPTRVPQTAGTPVPVTPLPSAGTPPPGASPEPSESPGTENSSQESGSGDIVPGTGEPEEPDGKDRAGNGQEIDWVLVIAIMAIVLFVAVAVMAMVVLKRKPRYEEFEDDI